MPNVPHDNSPIPPTTEGLGKTFAREYLRALADFDSFFVTISTAKHPGSLVYDHGIAALAGLVADQVGRSEAAGRPKQWTERQ